MSLVHEIDDVSARAMLALEGELVIPADLEARLLAAIPLPAELPGAAAEARAVHRPPAAARPLRRRSVLGFAAAAALAAGVAAAYAGQTWLSARHEERAALAREQAAESAASAVAAIDWDDGGPWRPKMAALEELRKQLTGIASRDATARLAPRYVDGVRRAFLDATRADLEASLRAARGEHPTEERAALQAYLLLGDPQRLHAEGAWEANELTKTAAAAMAKRTQLPDAELRAMLRPHVVAWIFLVETEVAAGAPLDRGLVDATRARLDAVAP
jgi:hypothetical protein